MEERGGETKGERRREEEERERGVALSVGGRRVDRHGRGDGRTLGGSGDAARESPGCRRERDQ